MALWILPRWTPEPPAVGAGRRPFESIGGILRQPDLRGALLTVLATSLLCAPLVTFSPVLVRDVFHESAAHFSAAVASFGAGGLLGAVSVLSVGRQVDRRRLSAYSAIACGALLMLAALNPWFWALPPLFVVVGATMTISNTFANTLLQAARACGHAARCQHAVIDGSTPRKRPPNGAPALGVARPVWLPAPCTLARYWQRAEGR